jgi:hypothetical protein
MSSPLEDTRINAVSFSLQKIPEMTIMAMDPRTSANHEAGHAVMHPGGMERVKEWLAPQVRDGGL